MTKQLSLILLFIFSVTFLSCQTSSREKETTESDTLTIQGLKKLIEKQIYSIDKLLKKSSTLDNSKVFIYGDSNIEKKDKDDAMYIASLAPIKSKYKFSSDRKITKENLKKSIRSVGLRQHFEYPESNITIYSDQNTDEILNTNNVEKTTTILKKIFYSDGTTSTPNILIEESVAEFTLPNAKSIDSVSCSITYKYKYQSTSQNIILNEKEPSFKSEDGYINLIKINKNEADIITSESFFDDKTIVKGITAKRIDIESISSWKTALLNKEAKQDLKYLQEKLENILKNIDKYTSAEDLKNDIKQVNQQYSTANSTKERNIYKSSYLFRSSITGLNISLLQTDTISIDVIIPNKEITPYHIIEIVSKGDTESKRAIIDQKGEIIVADISDNLQQSLGAYLIDYSEGKLYVLNTKSRKIEELPFYKRSTYNCEIDNNVYPIKNKDNKAGIADMNGKIILPTKYHDIYHCLYKGYIVTLSDGNDSSYKIQGLYKTDGTQIVPEEYANIDIKGNYAYASRMKNGKYTTDKFRLK